jgi:hypothetical protein
LGQPFEWKVAVCEDEGTTQMYVMLTMTTGNVMVGVRLAPKDAIKFGTDLQQGGNVGFRALVTPNEGEKRIFGA